MGMKTSLVGAIFTATQQRLFALLFGQPERSFFVTELIELAGVGRGSVQRELARLESSGLVQTERYGTQKHYQANRDSPLFEEICSIVHKTLGVNQQIREALEPVSADISYAVVYGSVAKKTDNSGSDVDLLVVSNHLLLEDLYRHLHTVEKKLGRKINPTMYTAAEFEQRMQKGSHFLTQVLAGPTLPVVGHLTRE